MSIKDWPVGEQPQQRLFKQGRDSLSTVECLAIILGHGNRQQSAVAMARQLLEKYGDLASLLHASFEDISQQPGIGRTKYARLQAALELVNRYLASQLQQRDVLSNTVSTRRYLQAQLRHHHQEIFACLFLDNQYHIIHFEKLFYGTLNHAEVHPRIIAERCLHHHASAVILAHNHPSGSAQASSADIALTQQIGKALRLLDVELLDHIIIAGHECVSIAELGLVETL